MKEIFLEFDTNFVKFFIGKYDLLDHIFLFLFEEF
jgi:hypothetical protein